MKIQILVRSILIALVIGGSSESAIAFEWPWQKAARLEREEQAKKFKEMTAWRMDVVNACKDHLRGIADKQTLSIQSAGMSEDSTVEHTDAGYSYRGYAEDKTMKVSFTCYTDTNFKVVGFKMERRS